MPWKTAGLFLTFFCHCSFGKELKSYGSKVPDQTATAPPSSFVCNALIDQGSLRTWSAGYGFANVEENVTVTTDTPFWFVFIG